MTDKVAFAGPFGIVAMIAAERLNVYLGIVIGGLTVLILLPKAIARSRDTFEILKRAVFRRPAAEPVRPSDPVEKQAQEPPERLP